MKNNIYFLAVIIMLLLHGGFAAADSPTFTVDLTGHPDSVWVSPDVTRSGLLCSSSNPERCVAFNLTLDPDAISIRFEIASGAIPSGALYYQVDCGTPTPVGQEICITGTGTHVVTFCKPGNNNNQYKITSIKKPSVSPDVTVKEGCSTQLIAYHFNKASLVWRSVSNDSVYNSYLSCTSGCDTVSVSPTSGYPDYVDYMVCGYPDLSCNSDYTCDTVRVNFIHTTVISFQPTNPVICPGDTNVTIFATVSGGKAPYHYLWSNGSTDTSIVAIAGTYSLTVTDATNCPAVTQQIIVTQSAISVNAGDDQTVCSTEDSILLNGSISGASGGVWSGGTGIFSPSDTSLDAYYLPSNTEKNSGSVTLTLSTTGNGSCAAKTDEMEINILPAPNPVISGNSIICTLNAEEFYSVTSVTGNTYIWSVNTGTILEGQATSSIKIKWTTLGNQVISVTETNPSNCSKTVEQNVLVEKVNTSNISTH